MSFKIAGATMPEPAHKGITVTDEPIWSSNTGRTASGAMAGDIVDWKATIEVTWPPLSFSDAKKLRDAIRNAGKFFNITYPDIESGSSVSGMNTTKKVYVGNIPRSLYSLASGIRMYQDITISFIEQ